VVELGGTPCAGRHTRVMPDGRGAKGAHGNFPLERIAVERLRLGILLTVLLLVPLVVRIRSEERLLADHFGAQYESYRPRTWRLLPGIY